MLDAVHSRTPLSTPEGKSSHEQPGAVPPRPRGVTRIRSAVHPPWSNRNLDLMLLARVAMSVSRSLAGVLTPIYLALEGFSAFELSAYVLTVALVSALLSALIGVSSDRIGRRQFLIILPLATAAAGVTFALTSSTVALFVMGAVGSFGRGSGAGAGAVGPYQPAESALVTDSLPSRHRTAAFGLLSFASCVGGLVGSLLALMVPTVHVHGDAAMVAFRGGFLAIAVAAAIAGILAVGLVEMRVPQARPARTDARPARLRLPVRSRWLLYRLWVTNSLNGAAVGMFGPFVTYWFFRRFDAGTTQVGILFAIINAATMVSTLSAASLAKRWGIVRTIAAVRIAQALLLIPMVLAPNFVAAGAVYFVRMVVQRIGMPLRQSYTTGLADPDERGSVAALSNLPSQMMTAASPLLTGYLMDEISLNLPFEIAGILQFLNAATFWVFFRNHPPEEERLRPATLDTEGVSPGPLADAVTDPARRQP